MCWISTLALIWAALASLTLRSLPLGESNDLRKCQAGRRLPPTPPIPEWEDSVMVPSNDAEATDGQGLCAVALGEDQGAQLAALGAGLVGVIELRNPCIVLRVKMTRY